MLCTEAHDPSLLSGKEASEKYGQITSCSIFQWLFAILPELMMHPAPKLPENKLWLMTVETNTKKATKLWLAILFQDHIKNKLGGPLQTLAYSCGYMTHKFIGGVAIRNYNHQSSQKIKERVPFPGSIWELRDKTTKALVLVDSDK